MRLFKTVWSSWEMENEVDCICLYSMTDYGLSWLCMAMGIKVEVYG